MACLSKNNTFQGHPLISAHIRLFKDHRGKKTKQTDSPHFPQKYVSVTYFQKTYSKLSFQGQSCFQVPKSFPHENDVTGILSKVNSCRNTRQFSDDFISLSYLLSTLYFNVSFSHWRLSFTIRNHQKCVLIFTKIQNCGV